MLAMRSMTLLLSACLVLACGKIPTSSGDDAVDGDQPDAMVDPCQGALDTDALFTCFIARQCGLAVACGAETSTSVCIDRVSNSIGFKNSKQRLIDAINLGRQQLDQVRAAACFAAVDAAIAQVPSRPSLCVELELPECDRVVIGLIADQGRCFDRDDCATPNSECSIAACMGQCCPGTCLPAVGLDAKCSEVRCAEGLVCDRSQQVPVCVRGDEGDPCTTDSGCDDERFCASTSRCAADKAAGVTCTSDHQCARPLTCVGEGQNPGTCRAVDTVGASCDTQCRGSLYCDKPPGAALGTCAKIPATIGASCSQSGYCDGDLVCKGGLCAARVALGGTCANYECQRPGHCSSEIGGASSGVCEAPLSQGRSCDSPDHCASGVCVDGFSGRTCQAYQTCE
jgi:hypothetical protein